MISSLGNVSNPASNIDFLSFFLLLGFGPPFPPLSTPPPPPLISDILPQVLLFSSHTETYDAKICFGLSFQFSLLFPLKPTPYPVARNQVIHIEAVVERERERERREFPLSETHFLTTLADESNEEARKRGRRNQPWTFLPSFLNRIRKHRLWM